MSESRISRRQILKTAGALGVVGALSPSTAVLAGGDNHLYRWDIIVLSRGSGGAIVLSPGGTASAAAEDGSKITMKGSGTFRSNAGSPQAVTGGGTWSTTGPAGTDSGTYEVTGFVDFDVAPGSAPSPPFQDNITGEIENARAGLAVLQIEYSDGSDGVLVVSCHLPSGSPMSIFEGITATKGFVGYWNHAEPVGGPDGANANRTQFHLIR
jgi:hypothetical protein